MLPSCRRLLERPPGGGSHQKLRVAAGDTRRKANLSLETYPMSKVLWRNLTFSGQNSAHSFLRLFSTVILFFSMLVEVVGATFTLGMGGSRVTRSSLRYVLFNLRPRPTLQGHSRGGDDAHVTGGADGIPPWDVGHTCTYAAHRDRHGPDLPARGIGQSWVLSGAGRGSEPRRASEECKRGGSFLITIDF